MTEADERGVLLRTPEDVEVLLRWDELPDESRVQVLRLLGRSGSEPGREALVASLPALPVIAPDRPPASADEGYEALVARLRPRSSLEHRACASECERRGMMSHAAHHHAVADALGLAGLPQAEALARLEALRGADAGGLADGDLAQAEEALLAQEEAEVARRSRAVAELPAVREALQALKMKATPEDRLEFAAYLALERRLRDVARDPTRNRADADAGVNDSILSSAVQEAARQLGSSPEPSAKRFATRGDGVFFLAEYGPSSWLVESPGLADPEAWWRAADADARAAYLRGRAAERLLRVCSTRHKECSRCGGSGRCADERCPRCLGLGTERVVVYR